MFQESEIQWQIDRAWKKIEELRELVGHQGDLLVRTMEMAGIMCFRCGKAMAGSIDASRAFLSFSCEKCGAKENYVIPGDMTEKRSKAWLPGHEPPPPTCGTCRWYSGSAVGVETKEGWCHRYPPIHGGFDLAVKETDRATFPFVGYRDTCGEHSPR